LLAAGSRILAVTVVGSQLDDHWRAGVGQSSSRTAGTMSIEQALTPPWQRRRARAAAGSVTATSIVTAGHLPFSARTAAAAATVMHIHITHRHHL